MNVEIETETPIFPFWEYLFRSFGILSLQCIFCLGGSILSRKVQIVVPYFVRFNSCCFSTYCSTESANIYIA
jgi:hypothetical protein